jgi:hypothetical protein
MGFRELIKLGGFNDPGKADVNWNHVDGKRQRASVPSTRRVRARTTKQNSHYRNISEQLKPGDKVLAKYHGSCHFYPGVIRALVEKTDQPLGYDVLFDDGTTDHSVSQRSIKRNAPAEAERAIRKIEAVSLAEAESAKISVIAEAVHEAQRDAGSRVSAAQEAADQAEASVKYVEEVAKKNMELQVSLIYENIQSEIIQSHTQAGSLVHSNSNAKKEPSCSDFTLSPSTGLSKHQTKKHKHRWVSARKMTTAHIYEVSKVGQRVMVCLDSDKKWHEATIVCVDQPVAMHAFHQDGIWFTLKYCGSNSWGREQLHVGNRRIWKFYCNKRQSASSNTSTAGLLAAASNILATPDQFPVVSGDVFLSSVTPEPEPLRPPSAISTFQIDPVSTLAVHKNSKLSFCHIRSQKYQLGIELKLEGDKSCKLQKDNGIPLAQAQIQNQHAVAVQFSSPAPSDKRFQIGYICM